MAIKQIILCTSNSKKIKEFEKELLSTANRLTNDKVVVVAVYTECWKGLSINPVDKFNEYLATQSLEEAFNSEKEQIALVPNYDLRFPVRVENVKALDTLEQYIVDLQSLNV